MCGLGSEITFDHMKATVTQGENDLLVAYKRNMLFMSQADENQCFTAGQDDAVVWHKRYGHLKCKS